MDSKLQKKSTLKAQFNSLEINQEDPTILTGKVIIHDFLPSWNNQCITEEVCAENMNTLVGKRIVCRYIPSEDNNGTDALTDHEDTIGKDRDSGNDIIITETIAIGFIENVYIDDYIDENNNSKRVLFGDIVIWNDDKYANIVGLLQEWINRGVKIHMSVEYLYCNYNFVDGIEYLQSPILYVAHTLLNSEQRGEYAEILPAYDVAELVSLNERQAWNKAINQILKTNNNQNSNINNKSDNNSDLIIDNNSKNKEENENMAENKFYKALCELSHGDIKEQIMTALSKTMTADQFYNVWLSNYGIYDAYFVYENYENQKYVNYKVPYTKTETDVVIDLANQVKVERENVWVEVSVMETQLNSLNDTIKDLQEQLNSKEDTIKSLNSKVTSTDEEKKLTMEKFNELTDTVASLNAKVKELQPLAEEHKKEQFEKALNSSKKYYKEKFENVDALDVFEKEETQELIKKSINSNEEEVQKAKFELNELIINNLKTVEKEPQINLNSVQSAKDNKNLVDNIDEFESFYGFKK